MNKTSTKIDPASYNINLRRVTVDGATLYEARIREFPDATEYADSAQEAYELALDTIEASLETLPKQGKESPMPVEIPDDYSGRITLRVPKNLHRSLSLAAEDEGISLNQYLVSLLGYHAGTRFMKQATGLVPPDIDAKTEYREFLIKKHSQ